MTYIGDVTGGDRPPSHYKLAEEILATAHSHADVDLHLAALISGNGHAILAMTPAVAALVDKVEMIANELAELRELLAAAAVSNEGSNDR